MNKTIYIRNFTDTKVKVEVPNWEDVAGIFVDIISGDEKLTVLYNHNDMIEFESCDTRTISFHDATYELPLKLVDKFSEFKGSSYDCMTYILNLDIKEGEKRC